MTGMHDQRSFWIQGLFWTGKFGKYFFQGLDLSRDFWGGGGIPNKLNTPGNFRLCNCIVSALF